MATLNRFFSVGETTFYCKKMPSRTSIVRRSHCLASQFQRIDSFLLEANAAGNFKLKPALMLHSENPRMLKNCAESLPVLYKWNDKAWMIAHRCTIWFAEYSKPTVDYCSQKDSFQNIATLVTQELWWECTMKWMLFSLSLPKASHSVANGSFWLSSLII